MGPGKTGSERQSIVTADELLQLKQARCYLEVKVAIEANCWTEKNASERQIKTKIHKNLLTFKSSEIQAKCLKKQNIN